MLPVIQQRTLPGFITIPFCYKLWFQLDRSHILKRYSSSVCFRVLELEESLGSSHLLQQNIKQKDEKVSSLNQVIQEREEKLAELENRSDILILIRLLIFVAGDFWRGCYQILSIVRLVLSSG